MNPTLTVLASGLNLLSFQGVTTFQGKIVVATVESNLVEVEADCTLRTLANVSKYGIPTGIIGLKDEIVVALSGQEWGHALVQVTPQGKISVLADLSALTGEFGAPFAVVAHEGYYPYYLVAISTDVIGSAGLIAKVTHAGKVAILATLAHSPFGIGLGDHSAIATLENGQILRISCAGEIQMIANLNQAQLGIPLGLARLEDVWMITSTTGWLVALRPDGTLATVLNFAEAGYGAPTTLTPFNHQLVVATQTGHLLQVAL